jgi:beta-glucosidase
LKGFDRIYLNPGQTGTITVKLDAQSFSYWSTTDHSWKVQPGQYRVMVGDSSTHLPLSEIIDFHS